MKGSVLAEGEVRNVLREFVFAELYTDGDAAHEKENARIQKERFGTPALPLYITVGPDGRERSRLVGLANMQEFLDFLKKGLERQTGSK